MATTLTRYGVVVADPAWRYGNVGVNGAAEGHYLADDATGRSTMSLDEIRALPVAALAADDAIMFLWTTWPLLEDAFSVVRAWDFEYVTGLPWIKIDGIPSIDLWGELSITPQYGTGWWTRGCSEPLLICRRGSPKSPRTDLVGLLSENFGHSRKPENVYHIAELLPGPYLELFARRRRDGWDAWGNQIPNGIEMEAR